MTTTAAAAAESTPVPAAPRTSSGALWAGRVLSGLALAFLAMDAGMKLFHVPAAVQGSTQLGYPEGVLLGLGLVQVACWLLYALPRTAALGAVLWTGYLGGAVATHVRLENPLFTHVLFPIYVGAFLWTGLWLRDPRVRRLLSARG